MSTTTNQEILERAREKHVERSERLTECFLNALGPLDNAEDRTPPALAATLHELGAIWREEAAAIGEAKKRAWKTTSEQLRDAATRVISVAQGLEKYGATPGPKPDVTGEFLDAMGRCGEREPISGAVCTKTKHDKNSNHHGNGITWPWENEPEPAEDPATSDAAKVLESAGIPVPRAGDWTNDDAHAAIALDKDLPNGETVTIPLPLTIGAADAPPAWAAEPVLDVIALNAPYGQPWPDHLSVSSIGELASCPLKWRLGRLHGAPRRPSWANVGGSAVHACIRSIELDPKSRAIATTPNGCRNMFHAALENEVKAALEKAPEFPIATWTVSNGGKEDRAFWEHDGPEMVHRYLEWREKWVAQGWELLLIPTNGNAVPVVEYEFLYQVPGTSAPLKGFIDSAWYHKEKSLIAVIDPKSGKSVPADYFQLAVYGVALIHLARAFTSVNLARFVGAYWSARSGELTPLVELAERCPIEEIAYRVNAAAAQLQAQAFPPNPSANYGGCGSCELRLSCPVGSRRNAGKASLTS